MEFKDYYQVLGVNKQADAQEIKRAYRKLAQKYHPDKNQNNKAAEEKFKEINEAYEVLGNPDNRTKYDQLGANYHRYQQMGGTSDFDFSQWMNQGGGTYTTFDMSDLFGGSSGGFSDFFEALFGRGGARPNMSGANMGRMMQGQDIEQTIDISLEEAYQGTTRTLSKENGERFTAKIPAGAKTGTKIRLKGKGYGGNGRAGDLFLVVNVLPHPIFERDEADLKVDVAVDVLTAVLGGKVEIPTLSGPVNLAIPAGTQGGRTFRLKGKGMPQLHRQNSYGNLLARVKIEVPEKLSEEERQLYEQLAALRKG